MKRAAVTVVCALALMLTTDAKADAVVNVHVRGGADGQVQLANAEALDQLRTMSLITLGVLLPMSLVEELRKLQDEVPPFSTEQARALIERDLRRSKRHSPVVVQFFDFGNHSGDM